MKPLLALSVVVLLSLGATACRGVGKGTDSPSNASSNVPATTSFYATPAASGAPTAKDSNDNDNDANDDDDILVLNYGHAASADNKQAVTALVKRYYAAAAAGDGAKACSMLVSSFAEAVPEDYGQAPGSRALRGKTCAAVVSKLFKQRHRQLATESATLQVIDVRVEGGKALAILHFATTCEPQKIAVHLEGRTWKIRELLDSQMP